MKIITYATKYGNCIYLAASRRWVKQSWDLHHKYKYFMNWQEWFNIHFVFPFWDRLTNLTENSSMYEFKKDGTEYLAQNGQILKINKWEKKAGKIAFIQNASSYIFNKLHPYNSNKFLIQSPLQSQNSPLPLGPKQQLIQVLPKAIQYQQTPSLTILIRSPQS